MEKLNNFFQKHKHHFEYIYPLVTIASIVILTSYNPQRFEKVKTLDQDLNNDGLVEKIELESLHDKCYENKIALKVDNKVLRKYEFKPIIFNFEDLDNDGDKDLYQIVRHLELAKKPDTLVAINDGNNNFSEDILYRIFTGD